MTVVISLLPSVHDLCVPFLGAWIYVILPENVASALPAALPDFTGLPSP